MNSNIKTARPWRLFFSPWVVIGGAVLLAMVVVSTGVIYHNHGKKHMIDFLKERGAIVIKALEAGARTGMRGMLGQGAEVQILLEELTQSAGVMYLVIVDDAGTILAHTDSSRIGDNFVEQSDPVPLDIGAKENDETVRWRMVERGDSVRSFEVYKEFLPLKKGGRGMRGMGHHQGDRKQGDRKQFWCAGRKNWPENCIPGQSDRKTWIIVGMDPLPFDEARRHDTQILLTITTTLILLGFAGMVSLFWAQSYRTSRSRMLHAQALASEVITNLPVGLIVTDREGHLAYVNGVAEGIMGRDREGLIGRHTGEVLPPALYNLPERLENGDTILEQEMEIAFSSKPVPLSVSVSDIITEEGLRVGHVFILRDLGEIRYLQAELRRGEKLAAIGNLAAGVAHEIRNPLSSIKGYATYFESRFDDGSEDQKSAQVMAREVDRLNRVITELLEFARPSELKPVSVSLDDLVDNSLRLIRPDAMSRNIEVESSTETDSASIIVDPDRFTQALLNVYINAIQSMENGGRLTVHAGLEDDREAFVEIADTGIGIPSEHVSKVFDPYFTTKPKGTGLGLAIVHKIVEAHRGRIKVDSLPGRGTVFTLMFPVAPEAI